MKQVVLPSFLACRPVQQLGHEISNALQSLQVQRHLAHRSRLQTDLHGPHGLLWCLLVLRFAS